MKAINLVPREARRQNGSLNNLNIGTTAVFAVLGLALAIIVAYVILANGVTTRKDELAKVNAQSAAAQQQVAKLKPYADLEALRMSLLDRVRNLAGGRYDWPTALSRIARALPKDTTLTEFDGTKGADAPAAPAGAPAAPAGSTAPASGPTVSLSGCTPSHVAVARVIDRLRSVEGVASVALQSSTIQAASASGSGSAEGCSRAEQFKLTIQLSAPAQPAAAAAPAAGQAAAGATTTTPPTSSPAPVSPQASTGAASGGNS
jgi:Tfp pilus assembly protein PilN